MASLDLFSQLTRDWFSRVLGAPTPVQDEAWPAIAAGRHTLVSAPTGTGKTLSAFLVCIDRMKAESRAGVLPGELQVIYISPLKSLAGDIRENLRKPLFGIYEEEKRAGVAVQTAPFDIHAAIRTGDTSQADRRRMVKKPPHILITTPESLYLLLTSGSGRSFLKTAQTVIIDELHAMIGTKRGAHLMLSLARLDVLCGKPVQRIGLSATIEPLGLAAEYLAGGEGVAVCAPKMAKKAELHIVSPYMNTSGIPSGMSAWQDIAAAVVQHCEASRSAIAFVDGRLFAEKLAYYVNQIAGEGFAMTHHGSLSKDRRLEVEASLRSGSLRLLCATSSMELGIDVGELDVVMQVGCPMSVSSTMQRLGRAGHNPGRTSVMRIFPKTATDALYSGMMAELARKGGIEQAKPPQNCLDILAQHLVSMAAGDGYTVDEAMALITRAWPFRNTTREDVEGVLRMLAGDYEHDGDIPARPRILYDRIHGRVDGDAYSRMLAVSAGGTIPDRGLYAVKTESGVTLGSVDEEFVIEQRTGHKFLLGTFGWQITRIDKDTVTVRQTSTEGCVPPFFKGDWMGRGLQTGQAFGAMLRELAGAREAGRLEEAVRRLGLDDMAAEGVVRMLERQIEATGLLPDDRTVVVEHFSDEDIENQLMVHTLFGRQVNDPLALFLQIEAKRIAGAELGGYEDDYGILLYPYGSQAVPEGFLRRLDPKNVRPTLEAVLPSTPIFGMCFRYGAARALMMGVKKEGRTPLWVQRLRGAELLDRVIRYDGHPLVREAKRECLEDFWDLDGVAYVVGAMRDGRIKVRELRVEYPSPLSLFLRKRLEADQVYNYSPTTAFVQHKAEEALEQSQMIVPDANDLERVSARGKLPENQAELHSLLMIEGDLLAGDLEIPLEWLETLARQGRVAYVEPGLWIAAEHAEDYANSIESRDALVRRLLRYRGAQTVESVAERYAWDQTAALDCLNALCGQNAAVEADGQYYHAELYGRARRETLKNRRQSIQTMPAERYAALLAERQYTAAPPAEQIRAALLALRDEPFPPAMWESTLLPARVNSYRPGLLDTVLAQGEFAWTLTRDGLMFHRMEDINGIADLSLTLDELDGDEYILFDALRKRGASFMQGLSPLLEGRSPHDALLALAAKGHVRADSFVPVRQWLSQDKRQGTSVRSKVNARVMALTSGRWEAARPRAPLTAEERLERAFSRTVLLCRETFRALSMHEGYTWGQALETLRVWEYTGRVRRGYFVERLSGAQYIREPDFAWAVAALQGPSNEIIWLAASDPDQAWGKGLPHTENRSFLGVPGTAVALCAGVPVAVFERGSGALRVFEENKLGEALEKFVSLYHKRRLFPEAKRVTVKQYPENAADALAKAGFSRQMQDFVLYQGMM